MSTLQVALRHSDTVYLFSESPPGLSLEKKDHAKIVHVPFSRIPGPVLSWASGFYEKV
jgi:hypothetical protein